MKNKEHLVDLIVESISEMSSEEIKQECKEAFGDEFDSNLSLLKSTSVDVIRAHKKNRLKGATDRYKYVSSVTCPLCEERIWSMHRHDMRNCNCGYCFIDGGRDYTRVGFGGTGWDTEKCPTPVMSRMRVPVEDIIVYEPRWPY